jgi:alpha-D-ribose 1-methylphosphonate 5-triphosphate synthase subunit PhnH
MKKIHSFDEVFDSQKMFRLILSAMSKPTTAHNIGEFSGKLFGEYPDFLAIAMTLLDNEVSFYTCGNEALAGEIVSLTLAKREHPDTADFIFVWDAQYLKGAVEHAKCGALSDPHKSATIIVKIGDERTVTKWLSGPGINGEAEVKLPATASRALEIRDSQFYEYPQGIDLIFINGNGDLFAIPRLVFGTTLDVKGEVL